MDLTYIFKLIIDNIDGINIGILTGIISSIFISRIIMIDTDLKEQYNRVQLRIGPLYGIMGGLMGLVAFSKEKGEVKRGFAERIFEMAKKESYEFFQLDFENLEKEFHDIAVRHNDLIESLISILDKNEIKYNELEGIHKETEKIIDDYKSYTSKRKKVRFYSIVKDKWIISIFFIMLIGLLIG
jgi:hypothetical protein